MWVGFPVEDHRRRLSLGTGGLRRGSAEGIFLAYGVEVCLNLPSEAGGVEDLAGSGRKSSVRGRESGYDRGAMELSEAVMMRSKNHRSVARVVQHRAEADSGCVESGDWRVHPVSFFNFARSLTLLR